VFLAYSHSVQREQQHPSDRQGALTLSGFLGSAVVAVLLVGGSYWMSVRAREAQDWVAHTHEVRTAIAQARADIVDMQNALRGFVITGDEQSLQPYESAHRAVDEDLWRLRQLTQDNPAQQSLLAELDVHLAARLGMSAAVIDARRSGGLDAARAAGDRGGSRQEMLALRDLLQRMESEESRLLAQRLAVHDQGIAAFTAGGAVLLVLTLAGLAVLYQQIHRKRQAEQRLLEGEQQFHAMTDSVTEYAILLLDPDGLVRTWNPGARRIKGYEADEIVGQHFTRFYTPQDAAAGVPQRALAVAAAEGRFSDEGWRVRKDGSRFWASINLSPLRNAEGRVTGYCKITRDLTERKAAEEALRAEVQERTRAESELQHLNARLEMLVAERTLALQQTNEALLVAKERLQALSARLISAQEEERRHVARELHDETGQALTLIRMQLAELAGTAPAHLVGECMQNVDRAIAHIRGLSLRLRPPMLDDLGLVDALEWVAGQQARAAGWNLRLDLPEPEDRLPPEVETACFRICQEALTNAARYSHATEVTVSLRLSPVSMQLEVADNGAGFDLERYRSPEERKKHFGLVSMSERASLAGGRLEILTSPGHGTRVRVLFDTASRDNPASAAGELFA
jgi:PAS domain S-box-containing protein